MTPCYCAALRAATRKTTAIYDEALAPAGIGLAQFSLLRKIERGGRLSLSELGRLASLDRSTVGRNIKVLRRMGLIEIGPGDDHREATVTLAEGGRAVLAQRRAAVASGAGADRGRARRRRREPAAGACSPLCEISFRNRVLTAASARTRRTSDADERQTR